MVLLTGATGTVGAALLGRLIAKGKHVRCLVRGRPELGIQGAQVQVAHGDLSEPDSFDEPLRGVHTVVHLAAAIRDQRRASIEALNGLATYRLVRAAEREGVERFVFFSAMGAQRHSRSRFLRAKALAERAVASSRLESLVFAPSIVYAPGDPWLSLLERLSRLPAMPVSGSGSARYQPISADDVAGCVLAALEGAGGGRRRFELAGPEVLSHEEIVEAALRALGRRRPLVHVPLPLVRGGLRTLEWLAGLTGDRLEAFATWDEAELMEVSMTTPGGTVDAEGLGVAPQAMSEVLGAGSRAQGEASAPIEADAPKWPHPSPAALPPAPPKTTKGPAERRALP